MTNEEFDGGPLSPPTPEEMCERYRAMYEELAESIRILNEKAEGLGYEGIWPAMHALSELRARNEAEIAELARQKTLLCGLLDELLENMEQPPDRNCSCHISPPCGDCVEWGGLREIIECCRSVIAKHDGEEMSTSDEKASQLAEAAKQYHRIYVDSATVIELLAARKGLAELRAKAEAHPDDIAVDKFAAAMKAKMAKQRAKGYSGWDDESRCPVERLQSMLVEHVAKGDPVDVGNFAMMLFNRDANEALRDANNAIAKHEVKK